MEQKERKGCGWFSALIIGLCVVGSCGLLAFGLSHFRSGGEHTMSATGSASVSFESDTIIRRG